MSKSDFDAFVKRQQAGEKEDQAFNTKQQLDEWLGYLNSLYKQITSYLQTYINDGAAQITYRDISINEEFIGVYTTQEMILRFGRSTVTFLPIGTILIGMKGRVDVQGPVGTARLALINKRVTTARQLIQVTITSPGSPPLNSPPPEVIRQIEWTWKISTPPPEMKFIELTQGAFLDMILAVADA